MLARTAHALDLVLQVATISLIVVLACIVLLGVGFRYTGNSLIWYDEVASVLLAWITFTGAALAVLRNAHLGFSGLLHALPLPARTVLFWIVEALFVAAFAVVAWAGWTILDLFERETMTTLRFVPRSVVQGVVPVSAALCIFARLITLPPRLDDLRAGRDAEAVEIAHEIARAEAELERSKR